MILSRRASVVVAAAAFLLPAVFPTICSAAKAQSSKLYVPAKIVKGSSVSGKRSFYRTNVPEDSLAGIRLGRKAQDILARWGNPSRITVAGSQQQDNSGSAPTAPSYIPPTASSYATAAAQLSGMMGLPGLPGYSAPGMTGTSGLPGMPSQQQSDQSTSGGTKAGLSEEEVTWTYDLANGLTLEFIITDGLITQITVGGVGPWGLSKTHTGLQLGDTYKLVLWVCGYPESQNYAGRFLRVSYVNKNRALYTFLNNKLVGITIAMVPSDLL